MNTELPGGLDAGDPVARAAAAAAWGLAPGAPPASVERVALLARADPEPRVRSAALTALLRRAGTDPDLASVAGDAWVEALRDADAAVRRRAAELAPSLGPALRQFPPSTGRKLTQSEPPPGPDFGALLIGALDDPDPLVAEAAAAALGELSPSDVAPDHVRRLAVVARGHDDALVREAAVAALGSLGHPAGLPAVLEASTDRPAIRRRAVIALAAFAGPEVEAALRRALTDRDWQVRQAAEDLLGRP